MDDMYGGGSVLSFNKVPCTPINGAFGTYFDVFGDVDQHQRLGTGDSLASSCSSVSSCNELASEIDQLPPIRGPSSASSGVILKTYSPIYCKNCSKRDALGSNKSKSRSSKSNEYSERKRNEKADRDDAHGPHILFLEEKQSEILGALHEEIRTLKHENAELKFQIHVILRQDDYISPISSAHRRVNRNKINFETVDELVRVSESTQREAMLELELETAAKLIQELKCLQDHYESKIHLQETQMADMMRQLTFQPNTDPEQHVNQMAYVRSKESSICLNEASQVSDTGNHSSLSGRQRVLVQKQDFLNRRNSLQSILPDNYRQQVATLPPILAKQVGNPLSSIRTSSSIARLSPVSGSQLENYATKSSHNRKKSSMGQPLSTTALRNQLNDTATEFCTDESFND